MAQLGLVFLLGVGLVLLAMRLLRWGAWVQQKEYRLDRLWLFLQTAEGRAEVLRLPHRKDFSRTGMKRPKLTLRSAGTLLGSSLGLVLLGGGIGWLGVEQVSGIFVVMSAFVFFYLITPLVVLLVGMLPGVVFRLYTQWLLLQAAKKLNRAQPIIIGITGSYGKTATKLLLADVLQAKFTVFTPPRSHNTIFSISKSILQGYANQEIAVIEYAAYTRGEIKRLATQLKPKMAILTGLAAQHLGLFGSIENIIAAKGELLAALPADGVVYSANPESYRIVAGQPAELTKKQHVHKLWESSTVIGTLSKQGLLVVEADGAKITTQLVGLQYLDTVRTVWQVALDLGLSQTQIRESLKNFVPPQGFMRLYTAKDILILDDGGTSNPAGFEAAVAAATPIAATRKVLVTSGIVDLGGQSSTIHTALAENAHQVVDAVWYLGEAGREEFEAKFGIQQESDEQKVTRALAELLPGSLVIIEGKMPAWFLNLLQKNI